MSNIKGTHHAAIICSNYERSKHFYTEVLGLKVVNEVYRKERDSFKLDLGLADGTFIELFSFPAPPPRPSYPEACGLRHLAFRVTDLEKTLHDVLVCGCKAESIRVDEITGKRFAFISDPDGLPIEFYEIPEGASQTF